MKKNKERISSLKIFFPMFKSFFFGVLIAEIILLVNVVGGRFVELTALNHNNMLLLYIISFMYTLLIILFLLRKNFWRRLWIIIKSWRFDLLMILLSGTLLVFAFEGIGLELLLNWISILSLLQLTVIISLPIIFFLASSIRKLQSKLSKEKPNSMFVSDKVGQSKADDKFGFSDNAEKFAKGVFNQGSSESLVFGIDAPWGTGKSTFVNLCKEYWNEKENIIVYEFNPLRYENKENILHIFIDGLIKEIKSNVFAPEIESLVSVGTRTLETRVTKY